MITISLDSYLASDARPSTMETMITLGKSEPRIKGYRFTHTAEGGRWNPPDMPAIRNAMNKDIITEMTKEVQELAWGVIHALNPLLPKKKFPIYHWHTTAMNNFPKNGYNDVGQPHSDWINMENLSSPNPRYDKTRGMAGGFFTGRPYTLNGVSGVMCTPGVDIIDPRRLPTVAEVVERHWYSVALNLNANLTVSYFAQGTANENPYEVLPYLWISSEEAWFPMDWLQEWDETFYPEPLMRYLPYAPKNMTMQNE